MNEDLNSLTRVEIIRRINNLAPIANSKLKAVRSKGLENYNQSFIKKYNILTNNKVNPGIVTKKGYFRKGGIARFRKAELIRRYEVMNEFVNNYYASAEYTEKHLQELQNKWGIQSNESIKNMFDLYREYGYDNYKDSDAVLTSMSKIIGDAELEGIENPGEYLEQILQDIEDDIATNATERAITDQDYINSLRASARILK